MKLAACRVFVVRPIYTWPTLTDAVCCTSQWPATPFSFSHASMANNVDVATQGVGNSHRLYRTLSNRLSPCSSYTLELFEIILWWNEDAPRTKLWTRLLMHISLHCTWRPSALTTELHRQVLDHNHNHMHICIAPLRWGFTDGSDGGQDQMNLFASSRGEKSAMQPFVKIHWPLVFVTTTFQNAEQYAQNERAHY